MHRLVPTALVATALVLTAAATPASALATSASDATFASLDASSQTRTLTITEGGVVADIAIDLVFQQVRETCAAPDGGSTTNGAYPQDMQYRLTSPAGTTVTLISSSTTETSTAGASYSAVTPTSPPQVAVRLERGGAPVVGSTNGGIPVSGTFTPAQSLDAFVGEQAAGDWVLTISDAFSLSPHCYSSATLQIDATPTLASGALPPGVVGVAYSASLPDPNPAEAALTVAAGSTLPAGLTLASDGTLSGTPTTAGTFVFDVVATDADGTSAPASFSVRIDAPSSISGSTAVDAQIGEPFSYVPSFDPGSPAGTVSATGLPGWLTLDPTTGALSGTPTGSLGATVVTLTASNGVEPADTLEVTIEVGPGPLATIALAPEASAVAPGSAVTFAVTGSDIEGNAVPVDDDDVVLVSSDASDEVDGLTVTFGDLGERTITARVGDLEVADTATVTVDAAPAPSEPSPSAPAPSAPAPSAPAPSAPAAAGPSLPQTGGQVAGWLALVAGLLVAGGLVARRLARG